MLWVSIRDSSRVWVCRPDEAVPLRVPGPSRLTRKAASVVWTIRPIDSFLRPRLKAWQLILRPLRWLLKKSWMCRPETSILARRRLLERLKGYAEGFCQGWRQDLCPKRYEVAGRMKATRRRMPRTALVRLAPALVPYRGRGPGKHHRPATRPWKGRKQEPAAKSDALPNHPGRQERFSWGSPGDEKSLGSWPSESGAKYSLEPEPEPVRRKSVVKGRIPGTEQPRQLFACAYVSSFRPCICSLSYALCELLADLPLLVPF